MPFSIFRKSSTLGRSALLCGILCCCGNALLFSQPRSQSTPASTVADRLSPEEAATVLENFRKARLKGDFVFEINLHHMPRRGDGFKLEGKMQGSWNEKGPLFRLDLDPSEGSALKNRVSLLSQNGANPLLWKYEAPAVTTRHLKAPPSQPHLLTEQHMFAPLFPGLVYTPFDLQMPFIYWKDHVFEGTRKVLGRSCSAFVMFPPASIAEAYPDLAGVRIFLDTQFSAMLKAEIINKEKKAIKTFKIGSFKKIQDQWIVKSMDLLDKVSRNKTRITILSAKLDLDLPKKIFTPENMLETLN